MPVRPLHDLGWKVDALLRSPAARTRFVSRIRAHLAALRSGLPHPALLAECYAPTPYQRRPVTHGWLSHFDDELVTLDEEYALLGALRECVYRGPNRLMPWKLSWPRRVPVNLVDTYDTGTVAGPIAPWVDLVDNYRSDGLSDTWAELVEVAGERLTDAHRGQAESWLRDVQADLARSEPVSLPTAAVGAARAVEATNSNPDAPPVRTAPSDHEPNASQPPDSDPSRPGEQPTGKAPSTGRPPPSPGMRSRILKVLRDHSGPLQRKGIQQALRLKKQGRLGHTLAWMVKNEELVNLVNLGYWPKGEPLPCDTHV